MSDEYDGSKYLATVDVCDVSNPILIILILTIIGDTKCSGFRTDYC